MKNLLVLSLVVVVSSFVMSVMSGCQGTEGHQMTNAPQARGTVSDASGGHVMACQKCYDEAVTTDQQYGKSASWPATHIIRKHICEDCKTEVTTYTENGKPMIKCSRCAPEGVACDKCLPPKTKS